MKVYYEAFDGKIFTNDDACLDYEEKMAIKRFREKLEGVKCWDCLQHPIEIEDIDFSNVDAIDYFYVPNEEKLQTISKLFLKSGICTPKEDGCEATSGHFFYDQGWQCCEEQIAYHQHIIETLRGKEK